MLKGLWSAVKLLWGTVVLAASLLVLYPHVKHHLAPCQCGCSHCDNGCKCLFTGGCGADNCPCSKGCPTKCGCQK